MGLSRSSRIITLLVIDTLFFFLEISVGYAVHSLALVADSFHMLNDVFSLLVALWAIKLAKAKSSSDYTYGWQRAEVLGALINGVFLLALCLSIFLEAIQRFIEPQNITNPLLILSVGSAGLASNILGLVLFHEHGHSHGHGDHGHAHGDEEAAHDHSGHVHAHDSEDEADFRDENGDIVSILPENYVRRASSPVRPRTPIRPCTPRRSRFASPEANIHVLPAMNRQEVLRNAQSPSASESNESSDTEDERAPLLNGGADKDDNDHGNSTPRKPSSSRGPHARHRHAQPSKPASSGHGNLNMRGVFLHVLGDALGNVGVILTALFVKYAPGHGILQDLVPYADPFISLVITMIIFASALPLVKSASKILLQGVPKGISLDDVKADVASIDGVESVHEVHIWQLSDVKLIASLHIQIAFDPEEGGGGRYMRLAKEIRVCLHAVGIHSSTIQPEYTRTNGAAVTAGIAGYGTVANGKEPEEACLLECGDECGNGKCCAPVDEVLVGNMGHGHAH